MVEHDDLPDAPIQAAGDGDAAPVDAGSIEQIFRALARLVEAGDAEALTALTNAPDAGVAAAARSALQIGRSANARHRAQQELNDRIIEALPGGLVHVRIDGQILRANQQALTFLGMSYDRLTQRYVNDYESETIWEDGTPCDVADYPVTRALVTGETQAPATIGVRRPDGSLSWGLFSAVPVKDIETQATAGAVVTILDITERKQREEERLRIEARMQRAQRLESLGVLAGGIAHDFNNLLVAIMGNAGLALLDLDEDAPAREPIARIERASQHAAELTRQLLAYSGRGRRRTEAIELGGLVRDMGAVLEVSVPKQVELVYVQDKTVPVMVEGDLVQLRQIVTNLITNGAEAIAGAGRLVIRTAVELLDVDTLSMVLAAEHASPGPYAVLEVQDDGVGMDAVTRERMFDPFFTNKKAGRGLGLAAVLGIVRSHGGAIAVDSEPDRGTTVRVWLPLSSMPAPDEREVEDVMAPISPGRRILVVDDEESVRYIAARSLSRAGFEVETASDGAEAVEMLEDGAVTPDVIVLDLMMPELDGAETLTRLRAAGVDAPAVLTSGYHEEVAMRTLRTITGLRFLPKPWGPRELVQAVKAALEDLS